MDADAGDARSRLTLTTELDGDHVRVVAAGEVDLTTVDRLGKELATALDQDVSAVVIDLAGVSFLDSSGLYALVRAHNRAKANGRQLSLVNLQPRVRKVFELTGLLSYLTGDD